MHPNDIDFLKANIQKFYHRIVKHAIKKEVSPAEISEYVFRTTQVAIYSLSAHIFINTHDYSSGIDKEIDEYTDSLNKFIKRCVQVKLKEDGLLP